MSWPEILGWLSANWLGLLTLAVVSVGVGATFYTYRRNQRRSRIDGVVDRYCRDARSRQMPQGPHNYLHLTPPPKSHIGIRGFLRAGARRLENDEEVRDAVEAIAEMLGEPRHPLGEYGQELMEGDTDLREFLSRAKTDGVITYEEALRWAGVEVPEEDPADTEGDTKDGP